MKTFISSCSAFLALLFFSNLIFTPHIAHAQSAESVSSAVVLAIENRDHSILYESFSLAEIECSAEISAAFNACYERDAHAEIIDRMIDLAGRGMRNKDLCIAFMLNFMNLPYNDRSTPNEQEPEANDTGNDRPGSCPAYLIDNLVDCILAAYS